MKVDKDTILRILKAYYTEGINHLESQNEEREQARAVFDMEYLKTVPSGSIYYPTGRLYASALQRAIVDTYTKMEDIAAVTPRQKYAPRGTSVVGDAINVNFNARAKEWADSGAKEKFLDDASLQSIIEKCVIGRVSWVEEKMTIKRELPPEEVAPEIGEDGVPIPATVEEEVVISAGWNIDRIPRDKFIWDVNATKWVDSAWGMEIHDKVTQAELYRRSQEEGYDADEVNEAIKYFMLGENRDDQDIDHSDPEMDYRTKYSKTMSLCHFFGLIQYQDEDDDLYKVKFCRLIFDEGFKYLFLKVAEDDDNAEDFIYFNMYGKPYKPYVVGYIEPEEGSVEGKSMMTICRPLQGEENLIRNNLRRDAEMGLNNLFVFKRGAGIDTTQLKNRISGGYVWSTAEDVRQAVSQLPHESRSKLGYDCLGLLSIYWQMMFGVTPLSQGISEPSNPEAPYSILQLTNAANEIIYSRIRKFNNTFIEPLFKMALDMTIQFSTEEDYQKWGFDLAAAGLNPEDLQQDFNLTIDAGMGATNDNAKRTLSMQIYWLLQQRNQYLASTGMILPPKDLYGPAEILKNSMPLYGYRDVERYTSTIEEVMQHTEQALQQRAEMQAQQAETDRQLAAGALDMASQAGAEAGMQSVMSQMPQGGDGAE